MIVVRNLNVIDSVNLLSREKKSNKFVGSIFLSQ